MEKEQSRWKKIKNRLKHTYRLIILNNETLEEVNSFNLTLLNLYIGICSFIFLGALLFYLLLAVTPLKRIVPGYGELGSNRQVLKLYKQIEELEDQVESQATYIEHFRHYVTGVVPVNSDSIAEPEEVDAEPVERILEDEILRKEIETETRLAINRVNSSEGVLDLRKLHIVSPVKGPVSTKFRPDIEHFGVDVLGPRNTAIKASMDGIIIAADWTLQTGNTISIQHNHNLISVYKHNSTLLKKTGDFVSAGEAIAIIGNSGTLSDGPHLHFELWQSGIPLNPEDYIIFE
jgi:murein DD-endopeptidase MepM/ murein hydrolase activator NlpD